MINFLKWTKASIKEGWHCPFSINCSSHVLFLNSYTRTFSQLNASECIDCHIPLLMWNFMLHVSKNKSYAYYEVGYVTLGAQNWKSISQRNILWRYKIWQWICHSHYCFERRKCLRTKQFRNTVVTDTTVFYYKSAYRTSLVKRSLLYYFEH